MASLATFFGRSRFATPRRISKHKIYDKETGKLRLKQTGEGKCFIGQHTDLPKIMRAANQGKINPLMPTFGELVRYGRAKVTA
jgi:hypothetical protein